MGTAKQLILENKLGQRVRTFRLEADQLILVYRMDTRRVEAYGDTTHLDEQNIEYKIIKKVAASTLEKSAVSLIGLGKLRMVTDGESEASPVYELPVEHDQEELMALMKKTAIGHAAGVFLLIGLSVLVAKLTEKEEPQLVTIVLPKEEPKVEKKEVQQHVKMAEHKLVEHKTKIKKVANKTVIKKVMKEAKLVQHKVPTPVVQHKVPMVVRNDKPKNLQNVGALAALGGLKNGTKGFEGLDANSLKNIRSAGAGSGGGGVGGAGAGGMKGMMPGSGLIAGSSGSGGRATSAGGYGTRGTGGGRAGYGKISLVGSSAGISLPMDEEASIEGGLDRDQIAAVINKHAGEITYCYEKGLQGAPNLSGRVSLSFVISGSGRVSRAGVAQTSLRSAAVEGCMIAHLKSWQFPHPVGNVNVDVQYPFNLQRVSAR